MKKIIQIINEEIQNFLNENEIYEHFFELENNLKSNIFGDFLFNNNETMTKNIPWKLIPFSRLKKIWEDYMQYGFVRDEKGVEYIEDIMVDNIIKINILTELAGHTQSNPEEDFEDNIGYHIDEYLNGELNDNNLKRYLDNYMNENYYQYGFTPEEILDESIDSEDQINRKTIRNELYENLKQKFWDYYIEDPKSGQAIISDYGLEPLLKNLYKLMSENDINKKISIMDQILNVIHQRSDIASWFIEGGSSSLNKLSGYEQSEKMIDTNQYTSNINKI